MSIIHYMPEQPLKVRQFQSLDDFRQWWWSDEVTQFCNDHPDQVDALKAHRFIKPYLAELERESVAGEAQEQAPPPTTKTFGKYVLEKKLGQGGMGAVYLAFDPALNRRVALKIMALKGQDAVERFQREARASAKLKHPNITPVYEVGTQSKFHYFTMEYVEGASLDSQIQSKKLNPKSTAEIIRDIALALDYAHTQKIIHRDIKPANILIDSGGRPYLTDFGLAKETTGIEKSLTLSGTVVGTPDYMSPEQARGEKHRIDPRSDIFSLGATLYHCITGHPPFRGKELYQVLEQVVHKDPLPPSRFVRALPGDLETICLKSMEKEPVRRYQTMRQLADDLTRFLKGDVILAKPVSTITKFWLKAKKNKSASIGIASVVLILLAVIIGLMVSSAGKKKEIESHRAKAEKAFEAKDYDRAKEWCTKLLTLAPDDEEIKSILKKAEKEIDKQKAQADKDKAGLKDKAERGRIRAEAKTVLDRISKIKNPDSRIKIAQESLQIDPTFGEAWQVIGYAYKDKRNYKKAVESFDKAIELDQTLVYSYYERGVIMRNIWEDDKSAVADLEKVLKYDPDSYIGYYAKGFIEMLQNNYDKAIIHLDEAIRLEPNFAEAYNQRGNTYVDKKEFDKAIADYTKAIEINPDYATAYGNRGNAYTEQGESEKAFTDLNKAIELEPDNAYTYNNRAIIYLNNGDIDKAMADLNKAIELEPKMGKLYTHRGAAYRKKGELDKASSDHNKAIELDPNYATAYYNRGLAYVDKAERESSRNIRDELIDKAIADYNEALRLDPKYVNAYNGRGETYRNKGELDKAIVNFNKAIELDAKLTMGYNNRGATYYQKGDLDKATADLNKAIELDSKYASAYLNRGNVYFKKDELNKAMADYNKAIELDPKEAKAYCNRGTIYENKEELDKAITDFNEAISIDPQNAYAHFKLGIIYDKKNDIPRALENYTEAIRLNSKYHEAYCNRGNIYYKQRQLDCLTSATLAV